MGRIELDRLGKRFGATEVIRDVSLAIEEGEFCVFVGPSGSGKSTLLRLIAGLESATSGAIRIDGRDVTGLEPVARSLAMVFQSYALYPHMTVRENLAFALETARRPRTEIAAKVAEAARALQLEPYLDRRPAALSGGQRQRVAIGRAIVRNPRAFLFDEPLSNLDAGLRAATRVEIARLHRQLGATTIYVTHDQVEAMTLADRIVVLRGGEVMGEGPPMDLFHRPPNAFVAGFLGSPAMNLLEVRVLALAENRATVERPGLGAVELPSRLPGLAVGGTALLGIRPQHLRQDRPPPGAGTFAATVELAERLGTETVLDLALPDSARLAAALPGDAALPPGTPVELWFDAEDAHLFTKEGQA